MKNKKLWSSLALLLTAALWGCAFVFQKFAVDEVSATFIIAWRFTIGTIILLPVVFKKRKELDKGYLIGGLVTGTTMGIGSWLQTVAMTYGTTPGKSAFLTAAYCVVVPFLYWAVTRERPQKNHVFSGFLCLIGIGFISLTGDFTLNLGDTITLVCSLLFAGNIVSVAVFSRGRNSVLLTTMQIFVAAVIGWIGLLFDGSFPTSLSTDAVGSILFLAVFPTALCLCLQTVGLKYTNPTVGTIILSLESVFGILFSVWLYHEIVTPRMGIGFVLVFAAVILAQLSFGGKPKEKEEQKPVEIVNS